MGKFICPRCEAGRHINDHEDGDPRGDACWYCGALVPHTDDDLRRWELEPLTAEERARLEHEALRRSELYRELMDGVDEDQVDLAPVLGSDAQVGVAVGVDAAISRVLAAHADGRIDAAMRDRELDRLREKRTQHLASVGAATSTS